MTVNFSDCIGIVKLYWDSEIQDYRHIRNDRRFNLVDAEHLLCKAYVCYIQTTPSRYVSVTPDFWKPWCHPASRRKPLWDDTGPTKAVFVEHMRKTLQRYEKMHNDGVFPFVTPSFCLYDNEQ